MFDAISSEVAMPLELSPSRRPDQIGQEPGNRGKIRITAARAVST
jgi:hypothetical protein